MDTQDFDPNNIDTSSFVSDDFDGPLTTAAITPVSKPKKNGPKSTFWSGLPKGQLNIRQSHLTTWWPGIAAFLWFASLVLFGAMSLFIYIQQDEPERQTLQVFGLIAALHLGALVVLFLATVAENPDPVEKTQGPFALSLQASFVEALSVAGLLVFAIFGGSIDETAPVLNKYLKIVLPEVAGTDGYLSVYALLLIAIVLLAFFGFSLLKRRDRLTSPLLRGEFKNEGEPPIASDSPRQRIAYLTRLQSDLLQMAHRAEAEALRDEAKLKDIAAHLAETESELLAVEAEILALCHDQEAFCVLQDSLKSQIDTLSAKASDPARTRSRKWLEKIKRLLVSGLGVVDSGDGLFLDALERLRLTEAALREALAQRGQDQHRLEAELSAHRAEARKLSQEAARLESELIELNRFAEHIDTTNDAWRQSYEWTALIGKDELTLTHVIPANTYNTSALHARGNDTIDKIRTGIFWLFGFTALLSVIGDFLLEVPEKPEALIPHLSHTGLAILSLGVIVYWLSKLIYSAGLMGSWRSIISSYRKPDDDNSSPEWGRTLKIMASNAAGILAFAVIFMPIFVWINRLARSEKTRFIKPDWFGEQLKPIDLSKITDALAHEYSIIPYTLIVAALLLFLAPLIIHIWEAQFRRTKDHASAVAIFKAMVMGLIGIGVLALINLIATEAVERISKRLTKSPTAVVETHTHLQCPLDQIPTNAGVKINAWRYGANDAMVLNLTPSLMTAPTSCRIDINPLGDTNFIVLIGTASEEGTFAEQRALASKRIDNAATFLSPALRDAIVSQKIAIYSVNLGKYCALSKSRPLTDEACNRANRRMSTGEATALQRPLIIVSGHVETSEEVTSESQIGQKVNDTLTVLGVDLNTYPRRDKDAPIKRLLVCKKDKTCELTVAPVSEAPVMKTAMRQKAEGTPTLALTPPPVPAPHSTTQASEGATPAETAVTVPESEGN